MGLVKAEFRIQMDSLGSNVLVLGATNLPWELDPGILWRFEKRLYIPLPEAEARTKMIQIHLGDTPNNLSDADFKKLGRKTEGFSGSDIKVLVEEALMEPIKQYKRAKQFNLVDGLYVPCKVYPNCDFCKKNRKTCKSCGAIWMTLLDIQGDNVKDPVVEMRDFVLKNSCASVSEDQIDEYEQWTTKFGQNGD